MRSLPKRPLKPEDYVVDNEDDRDFTAYKVLEVFEGEYGTMLRLDTADYSGPVPVENFYRVPKPQRPVKTLVTSDHLTDAASSIGHAYLFALSGVCSDQCLTGIDVAIARLTGDFPRPATPQLRIEMDVEDARRHLLLAMSNLEPAYLREEGGTTAQALQHLYDARTEITGLEDHFT
jgi:hypothetical protein